MDIKDFINIFKEKGNFDNKQLKAIYNKIYQEGYHEGYSDGYHDGINN